MVQSKRQLLYENDTEDGHAPKRVGREDARSNTSGYGFYSNSNRDLDSLSSEVEQMAGHEKLCYGTICGVYILLTPNTEMMREIQPWDRYCLLATEADSGSWYLPPNPDSRSKQRSFLDQDTGCILTHVTSKVSYVSFSAVIHVKDLYGKRKVSNKVSAEATVNVYGPKYLLGAIDRALSEISCYLQHPVLLESDIPYINPQFFYPTGEMTDLSHLVVPAFEDSTSGTSRAIDEVMESLNNDSEDFVGKGAPKDYLQPILNRYLLGTELKHHQLRGVEFILGREDPEVAKDMNRKAFMSIDHGLVLQSDRPGLGGILADVMGLGKTLTMLAAIICSRELKECYSSCEGSDSEDEEAQRSSPTLIVLPSRQLLDVWKDEMNQRFQPKTFHIETFHGQARAINAKALLCSDVVLTTYHTLEKDSGSNKVLSSVRWLRVVLDEGTHYIRNSHTRIHKAAIAIESQTRWCLTGTPIQNSLDDLRSLISFLHFEPFSQGKAFEQYIVKPFRQDFKPSQEFFDPSHNLKVLLKTSIYKITVAPTETEKAMFNNLLNECRKDFDKMAGKVGSAKKSNVLFSAIMKLRRVCNHGGIGIKTATQKRSSYLPMAKMKGKYPRTTSADQPCNFCKNGLLESDLDGALDSCPLCNRLLSEEGATSPSAEVSTQAPASSTSMMDMDYSEPPNDDFGPMPSSTTLKAQSSKMSAVIENIKRSCSDANSKSVVMSGWRDTLDILATMFTLEGTRFVQVDGRNPLHGRTELISAFRLDPLIKVLLISINTGAVGLTLTEANEVHIVEPQWNPTIEEQAIARVVRMGQTRPVNVFKYITEGSVEQSIVKLQEKKTRIIKLSMQDKDTNESDANLDRFKFTLDPNEWKADL